MRLLYVTAFCTILAGLVDQPAIPSKDPLNKTQLPKLEVERKPVNVKVVIDEDSKIYLDGREVCWPLEKENVEVEKLVVDQSQGYNRVVEVRFRSLPPPGYQKMPKGPKGQEKGSK